jgi:hypothetical protein
MLATCMYIQYPDKKTCNIRLEQVKHLEHTLETYVYSHYNMCNILIYFCNIDIHLQHISETFETLETYSLQHVLVRGTSTI